MLPYGRGGDHPRKRVSRLSDDQAVSGVEVQAQHGRVTWACHDVAVAEVETEQVGVRRLVCRNANHAGAA